MAIVASQWLIGTFDAELYIVPLLHSFDKETGYGAFNSSDYMNPELDRLTDR